MFNLAEYSSYSSNIQTNEDPLRIFNEHFAKSLKIDSEQEK